MTVSNLLSTYIFKKLNLLNLTRTIKLYITLCCTIFPHRYVEVSVSSDIKFVVKVTISNLLFLIKLKFP